MIRKSTPDKEHRNFELEAELAGEVFSYQREGFDERRLTLARESHITEGHNRLEMRWKVYNENGQNRMYIFGEEGVTCILNQRGEEWHGAWKIHEKMPIHMIPLEKAIDVDDVPELQSVRYLKKMYTGGYWFIVREHTHDHRMIRAVIERDEYGLETLKEVLTPNLIVDVGAHIGSFAAMARKHWPEARIMSYEPAPDSAKMFRANTKGMEIEFTEAALIPGKSRNVTLSEELDDEPASKYVHEVVDTINGENIPIYDAETVKGIGIVALIEELQEQDPDVEIDVLKLDCEGSEYPLLKELQVSGLLSKVKYILGEWHRKGTDHLISRVLRETHHADIVAPNPKLPKWYCNANFSATRRDLLNKMHEVRVTPETTEAGVH